MTSINSIELRDVLGELIAKHGGVRAAARVLKVSGAYVSRLHRGEQIWPSDALLRKLKVNRVVVYTRQRDMP